MAEKNKAVEKMAQRVLEGYDSIHNRDYHKGKKMLEPLKVFMHREERPNVTFLSYLAIAQIGCKDVENFLETYEELQKNPPANKKEEDIKTRVDEMFQELMETLNDKKN